MIAFLLTQIAKIKASVSSMATGKADITKNKSNDKSSATSINEKITLDQLIVTKVANIVGINCIITVTDDIDAEQLMFSGIPNSCVNRAVIYGFKNGSSTPVPFTVIMSGGLMNAVQLSKNDSIRISATYTSE